MTLNLTNNNVKWTCLLLAAVLISGCFGGNENVKKQVSEPPKWITSPEQDNSSYYFGVGEGRSIEASKLSALKEISAKLSVSVSGSTELNSTLRNDQFNETASVNIRSKVAKTKISNYDVIKTELFENKYYSLIKVSKEILYQDLFQRLSDIDGKIKDKVNSLNQYSILEQYAIWLDIESSLPDAIALSFLIKSVNPGFDMSVYNKKYNDYSAKSEHVLHALNIHVSGNKKFRSIILKITKTLTDIGIKAANTKHSGSNSSIVVTGEERQSDVFQTKTVDIRLNISILDENQKTIINRPINIVGSSVIDYKSARISAANNMTKLIEKNGILSFLGFGSGGA